MRTVAMWQLLGALILAGAVLTGTLVHRVDYFKSLGATSEAVAFGTALDPFTVVFSALLFGTIADRVPVRYVGAFGLFGLAASIIPMIVSEGQALTVVLHNVTWGAAAGGYITLNNIVWPNYFGRAHLGAIRGIVLPASIASSGLGPPIFGYLLDSGIQPSQVWYISLAAFVIAGLAVLLARPPRWTGAPDIEAPTPTSADASVVGAAR